MADPAAVRQPGDSQGNPLERVGWLAEPPPLPAFFCQAFFLPETTLGLSGGSRGAASPLSGRQRTDRYPLFFAKLFFLPKKKRSLEFVLLGDELIGAVKLA